MDHCDAALTATPLRLIGVALAEREQHIHDVIVAVASVAPRMIATVLRRRDLAAFEQQQRVSEARITDFHQPVSARRSGE